MAKFGFILEGVAYGVNVGEAESGAITYTVGREDARDERKETLSVFAPKPDGITGHVVLFDLLARCNAEVMEGLGVSVEMLHERLKLIACKHVKI